MKIVNYKRFIFSLIIILVISFVSVNLLVSVVISHGQDITQYAEHIVQKGETVWDIAKKYNDNKDIRDLVYSIAKDNNLNNFIIQPGETLYVQIN